VGALRTFDQLADVKGIGPAMLARLKPLLDLAT
jgi:DNA uptake protein ComE-like DNA-binding protein